MNRLLLSCSALALMGAACQPSTLQLRITAPPGTNQGRPLYMLVRKVDSKQYAAESYAEVSARIVQENPDLVYSEIIYPGTLRRLEVPVPREASLAVSFLFTAPDGTWQSFLNTPLPPSLDVELSAGRIQTGKGPVNPPRDKGQETKDTEAAKKPPVATVAAAPPGA